MCTLSAFQQDGDIIITMNRDEIRTRAEAKYLTQNNSEKITTIYPVDTQAGGSWFGFNEKGLVLALLNRYQNDALDNAMSRGEIIPKMLKTGGIDQGLKYLEMMEVRQYSPFDLMLFSQDKQYQYSWDGKKSELLPVDISDGFFISSSSVAREAVLKWRACFFSSFQRKNQARKMTEKEILIALHLQQEKKQQSRSIFMAREHSHTKSISQITLSNTSIDYKYFPENSLQQLKDFHDFYSADIQWVHLPILAHK